LFKNKIVVFSLLTYISGREELDNLFILNQDSAIIQILLDIYLLVEKVFLYFEIYFQLKFYFFFKSTNKLNILEIRSLICSYIHQMFINNASLAELLHNQGYSKALIPILVKCVPSMHICLDFVPRLLTNGDLKKQVNYFSHLVPTNN
jgi:integrator complex subunit 2